METNQNVCGQSITYELPEYDGLSDREAEAQASVTAEIEDSLAIIAEIQRERTSHTGEIATPLTETQINTIQEVEVGLNRSLAILSALHDAEGDL